MFRTNSLEFIYSEKLTDGEERFFPNFRYSLSSHLSPSSRERKKLLSLFQSIIIHVSIVTHRDDLTRRLRNLYTAGIYRSIRSGEQRIFTRNERHTMAVFSRYCPLYSPFPRSGEIILCARTKEIMLALLRSPSLPPSLSLEVNYSYLGERGDGFRIPVPAMTNARLFIILSA